MHVGGGGEHTGSGGVEGWGLLKGKVDSVEFRGAGGCAVPAACLILLPQPSREWHSRITYSLLKFLFFYFNPQQL